MKYILLASFVVGIHQVLAQYVQPSPPAPATGYGNSQAPAYQPPAPMAPAPMAQAPMAPAPVNSCPMVTCPTPTPCLACPAPPPPTICPPPPPPTVCPPPPPPVACPAAMPSQSVAAPFQQDVYPSPQTYENQRRKFSRKARAAKESSHTVVHLMNKCNDDALRLLMLQSISPNIVSAKVTIAERAAREMGGVFDVICTNGIFSYYAAAKLFCEVTHDDVSCFAFRHDTIDSSDSLLSSSPNNQESQLRDAAEKDNNLNRREEKTLKVRTVKDEAPSFKQEEKHFWKTMEKLKERNRQNRTITKPQSTSEPKLKQSRPTQSPDGVIDVHTQNIREETFQELLRELNDNNNDGSTEK